MKRLYFVLFILSVLNNLFSETIISFIDIPTDYERITYKEGTFANWIQHLPIKKDNVILNYKNSKIKSRFYNIYAVVDKPMLFKKDVEQCADYCMRFWTDYHIENDIQNELYLFNYSGIKQYYKDSKKKIYDFLFYYMNYSNSHSLKMGCQVIAEDELKPGDMIVQNDTGKIGHVSMIVDVCIDKNSGKLYLIGYSFMPAQEFHIEKASTQYGVEGWFTIDGYITYLKDHLDLGEPTFRRF